MSAGKGILMDAVKAIHIAWRRCRVSWTDQNAERFAQDFIDYIEPTSRQACNAMDRLESVCDEAKRACE